MLGVSEHPRGKRESQILLHPILASATTAALEIATF